MKGDKGCRKGTRWRKRERGKRKRREEKKKEKKKRGAEYAEKQER